MHTLLEQGLKTIFGNTPQEHLNALHADLQTYVALLLKWNKTYNLTAIRQSDDIVTHHLLDSLAAVPAFAQADRVLDVGSGGGLPGLVIAMWAKRARPAMCIDVVDAVHKKTAFLTQVKASLALTQVTVHTARVEQLQKDLGYDVITSRAFADLSDFVRLSSHLLKEGGQWIALKGRYPEEEIKALPSEYTVSQVQSIHVPGLAAVRHLVFIRFS